MPREGYQGINIYSDTYLNIVEILEKESFKKKRKVKLAELVDDMVNFYKAKRNDSQTRSQT